MDEIRGLLENQPLFALFLTVALGYLVGEINLVNRSAWPPATRWSVLRGSAVYIFIRWGKCAVESRKSTR